MLKLVQASSISNKTERKKVIAKVVDEFVEKQEGKWSKKYEKEKERVSKLKSEVQHKRDSCGPKLKKEGLNRDIKCYMKELQRSEENKEQLIENVNALRRRISAMADKLQKVTEYQAKTL